MKLFIKILLFVLVALVTNEVESATILFANIQEITTLSFQEKISKMIYNVIENDLANGKKLKRSDNF